ncbi:MAG TPA: hypothetical protein PKV13_14590, partial [Propionicimonas sp.]|nr:hypothetical protein [Propionicimonas sp.]
VILAVLGVIAVAVGAVMLFMAVMVDLKVIWEIATRYSTDTSLVDPRPNIMIITGVALGAGLLLGLGIGLPAKLALSQKKLDELVDTRVQQRLGSTPPSDPAA